jgi:DNA-binding protein H-NS
MHEPNKHGIIMNVDLSTLSVAELKNLANSASNMIGSRQQEEIKAGYAQVVQIAQGLGITVEELIATGQKGGQKATKKTTSTTRKPVAPRYRNTDNASETWTGRGKQPRWLAAKIAGGATVADFLIAE